MQRPYEKRVKCRGEACFAQRSEDEYKLILRSVLTLRLPWEPCSKRASR